MLRVASQGGVLDKPPPPPSVLFGSGAVSEPEGGASPKPSLEPEGASRATAPSPAPVGPASGDATARSSVPGSSLLKPPTAPLRFGQSARRARWTQDLSSPQAGWHGAPRLARLVLRMLCRKRQFNHGGVSVRFVTALRKLNSCGSSTST